MIVESIIEEAKSVLGKCSNDYVFKRISDAVRLANNQGKFDCALGQMDLCVCDGCVTLPYDVGTVLAVNNGGLPTLMRDQWFQYHANGTGSTCYVPWNYTDELGMAPTYKDPPGPCKIVAIVEVAADSNCEIRVFGFDENGKRIYTPDANGVLQDGFLVPSAFGYSLPNPDAPSIVKIDRIQKAQTVGFVKLIAVDPDTLESQTQIGYYLPWETSPSYRRIRVPNRSWIRIKYKKKDLDVRSLNDWINIDNREALLLLLKAVQYRLNNQIENGKAFEIEGMRLLSNEAEALRPPGPKAPQVIFNEGIPASQYDTLYY